jgi:agmatinase
MTRTFEPDHAAGGGIFGLPFSPEESRVVLVPVPWDATTSYRPGAARGPAAILAASGQIDLEDRETGRPHESGIAMLPIPGALETANTKARALAETIMDGRGAAETEESKAAQEAVNGLCETMNSWVHETASAWLDRGKLVGVVGGDHSSPFGLVRALGERHPRLGILHVDAHADLRDAYEGFLWSHASIMHNVIRRIPSVERIVQVGVRDFSGREAEFMDGSGGRILTVFDPDIRWRVLNGEPWRAVAREAIAGLPDTVYVSFDIDGLDPALCPNTGTPVPGGLSFSEATALLRELVESGRRIVGFDLNEVAPDPAGGDEWDANVGMRILYKLIGFALLSEGNAPPTPR